MEALFPRNPAAATLRSNKGSRMFLGHPDCFRVPSCTRPIGSARETWFRAPSVPQGRPFPRGDRGAKPPEPQLRISKWKRFFHEIPLQSQSAARRGQGCFLGTQTWSALRRFRKGDRFREETGGRSPQNRN
jgi:hypothetical protein